MSHISPSKSLTSFTLRCLYHPISNFRNSSRASFVNLSFPLLLPLGHHFPRTIDLFRLNRISFSAKETGFESLRSNLTLSLVQWRLFGGGLPKPFCFLFFCRSGFLISRDGRKFLQMLRRNCDCRPRTGSPVDEFFQPWPTSVKGRIPGLGWENGRGNKRD